ncbi:MAG: hypothetical protein KF878_37035 [Planctomycetes bacterium]|nr:hypothetical protein [Planctomycetota bacterium]
MQAVARVPWLVLLAVILGLSSGCAAPRRGGLAPASDCPGPCLTSGAGLQPVALEPTRRHHGVRAAIIAGVVFIIVGAFLVDLILLPFSYRRRHMFFPCCRTVIGWCD